MTFSSTDGSVIYYETHGAGDPLLLISGMGADHRVWDDMLPHFTDSFTCIVYDHRGTGASTARSADFTIKELAEDACTVLDACNVRKATVVGISMGGAVAQELAINHADRVGALILVSTWAKADAYRRVLGECRMLAAESFDRRSFWREHLLWCYSRDFYRRNPEKIDATCRFLSDTSQTTEDLVRQHRANLLHDTAGRLNLISAPTLIVAGGQDISTPPELARALSVGIAGSRLIFFEHCGHSLTTEDPDGFAAAAIEFLSSM